METARIHRVGTVTTGIVFIAFGVMFILHLFVNVISYDVIFKLWPLILVGLGVEVLLSNLRPDNLVYDKGAIVLMFILAFFAMGMAGADMVFQYLASGQLF